MLLTLDRRPRQLDGLHLHDRQFLMNTPSASALLPRWDSEREVIAGGTRTPAFRLVELVPLGVLGKETGWDWCETGASATISIDG